MTGARWAGLAAVGLVACRSPAPAGSQPPSEPGSISHVHAPPVVASVAPAARASRPSVATDWCVEGLSGLDEDVCYLLPPADAGAPRRLLVYLHGIVPPTPDSPQQHTVERAVARACSRGGLAAIVPRGRRGLGPAQARDWWAWPTTASAVTEQGPSLIARWARAKHALEAIAGAPFARTYLAGSSNGAYFLAALAARGDLPSPEFPVDGFGAMSGGVAAGAFTPGVPRPFYVGWGTFDDETRPRAHSLVAALQAARWPVLGREHPLGHGANEVYLDEAFAFWDSNENGAR